MSFHGLYRNGTGILNKIKILDAFRAQIKAKRGFAKPSNNNIFMDLDFFYKLKGSVINKELKQGCLEGLVIKINQKDFPKFCKREGYARGIKLIKDYSEYDSIGEELWNLFHDSRDNDSYQFIKEYRKNLRERMNYTSEHYIPHPLEIQNLGYAILFIAPGKYETGNINLPSRKEQEGIFDLMGANDVLKRSNINRNEFFNYTLECLYGGVHGINIRDIIDLISEVPQFLKDLQKKLQIESLVNERTQFANEIFDNLEIYQQKFGNLDQNLRRSGLKSILDIEKF